MKQKSIVAILSCTVFIAAFPPAFGEGVRTTKKQRRIERVEKAAYTAPAAAVLGPGFFAGACHHDEHVGCVAFPVRSSRDRFVSIEVTDQSGLTVYGVVLHPETRDTVAEFCGTTDRPILLSGLTEVDVWLLAGVCPGGTPSVVTAGTVTATFSNLP